MTIVTFQTQRHYRNHTNDLTCLCVHPSEPLCASGQAEGHSNTSTVQKPHVQVWNYETLELAHIIGLDLFDVDIGAVAFSHKVSFEISILLQMSIFFPLH